MEILWFQPEMPKDKILGRKILPYIPKMTSYPISKDILFSPTFKIKENKVPLFFWIKG